MKNKLAQILIAFILLFPFRLPISVMLIKVFNFIASIGSADSIPENVLAGNIVVTKILYNLFVSVWLIYQLEMASRQWMGRVSKLDSDEREYGSGFSNRVYKKIPQLCYWWIIPIAVILASFNGYDIYSTIQLIPFVK